MGFKLKTIEIKIKGLERVKVQVGNIDQQKISVKVHVGKYRDRPKLFSQGASRFTPHNLVKRKKFRFFKAKKIFLKSMLKITKKPYFTNKKKKFFLKSKKIF